MRVAWESVGRIVERVVADGIDACRLDGLVRIGVDEISWRRHHRYLTRAADHDTGAIVWMGEGRNQQTLQGFFDALTDEQRKSIRAVSIDMSAGYENAVSRALPDAEVSFDPFHVVALAGKAVDQVCRSEWNAKGEVEDQGRQVGQADALGAAQGPRAPVA